MEDEVIISSAIEEQVIKQWETVGISNDFVYCKVMQDKGLLAELIHLRIGATKKLILKWQMAQPRSF